MSYVNFVTCSANSPFTANTPVSCLDNTSGQQELFPAGSVLVIMMLHLTSTLSTANTANFAVGYSGNNGALIPLTAGCTNVDLNAGDAVYTQPNLLLATLADKYLTVTTDADVADGSMEAIIGYTNYPSLPSLDGDTQPDRKPPNSTWISNLRKRISKKP